MLSAFALIRRLSNLSLAVNFGRVSMLEIGVL
jgi:hypothetical protein